MISDDDIWAKFYAPHQIDSCPVCQRILCEHTEEEVETCGYIALECDLSFLSHR